MSDRLMIRCDAGHAAMVDQAARAQGMTASEWQRQAHRTVAQLQGIDPAQFVRHDAGSLYDSLKGGKRRWALIVEGSIADLGYHDAKPEDGRTWLPVVHVDSEPFDLAKHWRMKPEARIEGDKVVVTYPVVHKTGEWA